MTNKKKIPQINQTTFLLTTLFSPRNMSHYCICCDQQIEFKWLFLIMQTGVMAHGLMGSWRKSEVGVEWGLAWKWIYQQHHLLVACNSKWKSQSHLIRLQFFSIAKTLKPIGWTKFSVAWPHLANCAVCCQYLKPFYMVKHNLQISLRLFSKTLNRFSFSKHLLHSNAHVTHTGKHKWQKSNTNREHMSLIEHNHSKLM